MPRFATGRAVLVMLMLFSASALAQQPATHTLTGRVAESGSGTPLPSVQVAVHPQGSPTVARAGMTDSTGRFVVTGVAAGSYELRFRRLGFSPALHLVTVPAAGDGPVDVGTIALTPTAMQLEGVEVTVAEAAVVHAPDRDIYSAAAVAGAAGGSATDVLRGIPDLEVDIDGGVSLLGESPTIYINGRPAPMTGEALALFLEQFAAENIKSVEVMPNPSARYAAEGAGGIVNIVLEKDVGLGISGNVFVNGGTRGQFRGGGRATWQRGPLTLNGGASLGLSGDERTSSELRQNLLADPITFLEQAGRSDRSSWAGNVDLGADYELGARTELSAELRVNRNVADAERVTRYTEMDAERNPTEIYDRLLVDDGRGTSLDLSLELEHQLGGGDERGERRRDAWERSNEVSVEVEYERGGDLQRSLAERRLLESLGEVDYATELTWEEDRETDAQLSIGADYARGIGERGAIELGYEGEFGWTDEGRLLEERLPDGTTDPAGVTSRGFLHRQQVHGGYLTLSRDFGRFGAQLGARAEHADSRLELPGDGGVHGNDYFSLFPSANLSYELGEGKRLRLSYSMRVRRPSSNVLNPINTSSDPLDRRVGNPGIEPQYTHSIMLNASWSGELGYLRASPFLRRSTNEWEELRTVDDDGVATTTYENLGSTDAYGVSLSASLRELHGVGARVSLNGQRTIRHYDAVLGESLPSATRWSVNTNLDGELAPGLSAQGSLTYNPARDLPQGRASATLMTRVGMRWRFLDRRASLNLNVADPFDIYDSSIERRDRSYVETGRERRSMRRLTLSLSYSFQGGGGGRRGGGRGGR